MNTSEYKHKSASLTTAVRPFCQFMNGLFSEDL